jgi:hypothetical protein
MRSNFYTFCLLSCLSKSEYWIHLHTKPDSSTHILHRMKNSLISDWTLYYERLVWKDSRRSKKMKKQTDQFKGHNINPLNAELNTICHLLILLGDLTFMGPCIVSIFQYISNKMQRYTVYLYLETAPHISGGTSTHHQERIQLYLQHLVFVTPLWWVEVPPEICRAVSRYK